MLCKRQSSHYMSMYFTCTMIKQNVISYAVKLLLEYALDTMTPYKNMMTITRT